jgi:exosortase D (VPLPA-CTERM-specific)
MSALSSPSVTISPEDVRSRRSILKGDITHWILLAVTACILGYTFRVPVQYLSNAWLNSPEYNYGPIIPFIAAAMLWRDLRRSAVPASPGWAGVAIVGLGLLIGQFGILAAFVFIGEIGLLITIIGLFVTFHGWRRSLSVWPGLVYLGFAVPLTNMLLFNLSEHLQLISSQLGVAFIRSFGIPVYLEGNVIDLGQFKLQVVEACSGLRYLFPLASFGFLCAYLFVAPAWQRVLVFLSSAPITVLMNSLRIGITGILVDRFGIEAAQGFFHDFEGWIIFCGCVAFMLIEMKVLVYVGRDDRSLLRRLDLDFMPQSTPGISSFGGHIRPAIGALAITVAALGLGSLVGTHDEVATTRSSFSIFPREIADWRGSEAPVDQASLDVLKPYDYLSLNFVSGADRNIVNLWSTYFASQRVGSLAHSPSTCIPGGGWQIEQMNVAVIPQGALPGSSAVSVNRILIQKDGQRELVYYWFQGRGRVETSETLVKWHILTDALSRNRTDGALVRLVTSVGHDGEIAEADATLQKFMLESMPLLSAYIPN